MPRAVAVIAVVLGVVAAAPASADARGCERRSDAERSAPVPGRAQMVAAAHPEAAAAGCEVLRRGGGAIDAAVAVQAVLAVVEPQSSGLGGGTLITHFDRSRGLVRHYDGLASAPALVTDGLRTPTEAEKAALGVTEFESEAASTGRAVGIPGTVRVLEKAHVRGGRLPWRRLFDRAIALADQGFPMPPYLHDVMEATAEGLRRCRYPDLRALYCDGDAPKPLGAQIVNRELAQVLREVRTGGAQAFYDPHGTIAPAIVARAAAGPYKLRSDAAGPAVIPSLMTAADLAEYRAVIRPALCRQVLRRRLCTAPPPSFGGVTVLQELALIERGGPRSRPPLSAERVHLSIEASRLANLDRRRYVGDPDFAAVPVDGLLDNAYLDTRFRLISPDRALPVVEPGVPPSGEDRTSHVSIVDRARRRGVDDHHRQLRLRRPDGGARDRAQQRARELHAARLDLARRRGQRDAGAQATAQLDGAVARVRAARPAAARARRRRRQRDPRLHRTDVPGRDRRRARPAGRDRPGPLERAGDRQRLRRRDRPAVRGRARQRRRPPCCRRCSS